MKVFAKNFMKKYGVRTAAYAYFSDYEKAIAYLDELNYPIVIKASGLVSGKGVIIAQDEESSFKALELMMKDKDFGASATNEVLIEEYFCKVMKLRFYPYLMARKFFLFSRLRIIKKIGEGETGPNTGGMGVVTPNTHMNETIWRDFDENILKSTLQGLSAEKLSFAGMIFFGLMITERGVYLLEYNLRMGDTEKKSLLPLMESDFLETIQKAIKGESIEISWKPAHSRGVVMASWRAYPGSYRKGYEINDLETLNTPYYIAGAEEENDLWITSHLRRPCIEYYRYRRRPARRLIKKRLRGSKENFFYRPRYRNDIGLS